MWTHISPILVHLLGQCENEIATYAPVFGGCNSKYWIIPDLDCKKTCFIPAANQHCHLQAIPQWKWSCNAWPLQPFSIGKRGGD